SLTPLSTLPHSFFSINRPPSSSTLFPYTTLFRSHILDIYVRVSLTISGSAAAPWNNQQSQRGTVRGSTVEQVAPHRGTVRGSTVGQAQHRGTNSSRTVER